MLHAPCFFNSVQNNIFRLNSFVKGLNHNLIKLLKFVRVKINGSIFCPCFIGLIIAPAMSQAEKLPLFMVITDNQPFRKSP